MSEELWCTDKYLRRQSDITLADISALVWGTAEMFDWSLVGQSSTKILPVAVVQVYFGRLCVDHTTLSQTLWCYTGWYLSIPNGALRKVPKGPHNALPDAPVLHWVVIEHSLWGTAESTESTFAGQKSTLRLPVATVKFYFGKFCVNHTTLSQTLWCYTGWYFRTPNGALRKVLNRPWLVRRRRGFIENYSGRVRLRREFIKNYNARVRRMRKFIKKYTGRVRRRREFMKLTAGW